MPTDEDEPIDATAEVLAFVENACTEITEMRAEMTEMRASWERFRIKMMRDFVALVDEYRNIDAIRSDAGNQQR